MKFKKCTIFIKIKLAICFFYCLYSSLCLGYSTLPDSISKNNVNIDYTTNSLTEQDYAYFNKFYLKKNNELVYPSNRLAHLISAHQDLDNQLINNNLFTISSISPSVGGYILNVNAPFNPGCLCLDDPLLVTAKMNQPPYTDINISGYTDNKFYYQITNSITSSVSSTLGFTAQDALKEPLSFFPTLAQDRIINALTSKLPMYLFLRNGPITTVTPDAVKLAASFGQSGYDLVRMLLVLSGQEIYIQALESGGAALSILLGSLRKAGLPIPDLSPNANNSTFFNNMVAKITDGTTYKPLGYSVPIGFQTKMGINHDDYVKEFAPYTRPIYKRPLPIQPTITTNGPVYIKPWSIAKHSLYVLDGETITFKANPRTDEDPNNGVINYWWAGFPSVTALGFGQAVTMARETKNTSPFSIKMNSPFLQSGVYALMAYRGPMPPIGCTRVSEWTEINVGCSGVAADREGLIKLKGDYDFAHSKESIFNYENGKRDKKYEPIVCEGESIEIVSSDNSYQGCEWTYEWFGPQKILKEGTVDTYVITPNVLIGGSKQTVVNVLDEQGRPTSETATISRPIESNETITIKDMTPEMSGVYTRIASRTGKGAGANPLGWFCPTCFRIAQLTITVKPPSLPKLNYTTICEGEDLIISLSPTTNDFAVKYKWAYKKNPSDPDPTDPALWSAWSTQPKIVRSHATADMSGIYLVKTQNLITYNGKQREVDGKHDRTSFCESVNSVSITVQVRKQESINLSFSPTNVYAGREAILTASFSGTTTAPVAGLSITLTDIGGTANKNIDYELIPPVIYIPPYKNSNSITITTKWIKPKLGDLAKTLIVMGSVTNSTSAASKTCYHITTAVTLTIKPLFKPEITNGPVSPICSDQIVNIALSSTLPHTTYHWTTNTTGTITGFKRMGSSSTIKEKLVNKDAISGTVLYTVTPQIADPDDANKYIDGDSKSFTVTVIPLSNKIITNTKITSDDTYAYNWQPENVLQNNVTYRWFKSADKSGGFIHEGKGISGTYTILTPKPATYVYFITTQQDGYCENEPIKIELTAKHHIQLAFDKSQIKQGESVVLTASLSGTLVAPAGGITITLNTIGSTATDKHYNSFPNTIYFPKDSHTEFITVSTNAFNTMDTDKILNIGADGQGYTFEESASVTITRDFNINRITLKFTTPKIRGTKTAKLIAQLPPNILAGHNITITLERDKSSTAEENKNYKNLIPSFSIPVGSNTYTFDAFIAANNGIIHGETILTLNSNNQQNYMIATPKPVITILDETSDRVITLSFEYKDVRGGEIDKLNLCLPDNITSAKPIHIKLKKRPISLPDEPARKNINYKEFKWDLIIPPFTNCISTDITTLVDRKSDIKTLWLTGTADGYTFNSDKVNIITPKIIIPKSFSPDGDKNNDTWEIHNLDLYKLCTVNVTNRWGQTVFKCIGYPERGGWDGTFSGKTLPDGPYYYMIDLKDGTPILRGYVAIIR